MIDDFLFFREGRHVPLKAISNNDGTYSLSTSSKYSYDYQNKQAMNTVVGEQIVAERTDFVNVMFQYNISDIDTVLTQTGTGTIRHDTSKAFIGCGTGIGKTVLKSKDSIRYVTGHEVNGEMTVDFGEPQEEVLQTSGIGDDTDGFVGVGYNGLVFGLWLNTIDTGLIHIPQTEWNGDKLDGNGISKIVLNPLKENIYKFTYGWYGVLPLQLSVYTSTIGWVTCHTYQMVNETDNPHLGNPTLPMWTSCERVSGSGENVEIKTSSWRGGIVGKVGGGVLADRKFIIKTKKTLTGINVPVYSLRNKSTFQGRANHVRVRIGTVTLSTDGTKAVEFDIYKGGTLTGGTWTSINPDNSVCEYNNTSTSYTSSNDIVGGTVLGKVDRDRINLVDGDVVIPLYPNETLHFVATTPNTSEVILYFRHIEEF